MEQKDVAVVIPCYEPDENLGQVVAGVLAAGFEHVVVVDDGSSYEKKRLFDALPPECAVLHHNMNIGKGMALKTGIKYCKDSGYAGAVTIDADGQHAPEDVRRCAEALCRAPDSIIIGCRNFSQKDVPFKSRWGNRITRFIFRTCGVKVSDTQTGLRAFSAQLYPFMLGIQGSRYEYETNMLLEAHKSKIPMREVSIRTIYLNGNQASHFHPFRDGVLIYATLLKYAAGSLTASAVDISMYWIFGALLAYFQAPAAHRIVAASFLARAVSSFVNYRINERVVFKKHSCNAIFKYYALCVAQITLSAALVALITTTFRFGAGCETGVKMMVDFLLFFASYNIQKRYIF
jgi:glycosyltransferase involved in cell wall biosynthesis